MDIQTSSHATARRMARLEPSRAVTEILKLAERPDVISLAGGLPDPRVFALERVRDSMERVLRDEGTQALNYGPNPGFTKLREWIAERMHTVENTACTSDNILVVSGGVEGINLTAMAMLDEGDTVIVGAPTYMAALHVFRAYGARIVSVPLDEEGIDTEVLQDRLRELGTSGVRPKFLYTVPSFQNPSGRTMSEARRRTLVSVCRSHDIPILEDHAYAELAYDEPRLPSLKSLDPGNVIFVHTFSKIFGPGLRLGWVAADEGLVDRLGLCKLGTDQCANTLTQRLVYAYGTEGHIEAQVQASVEIYRRKRDVMERAMREHFPAEATWVHPGGGFFLWVELPEGTDSEALLLTAIENEKTAFVAGPCFFADGDGARFLRLSFSYVSEDVIEEGVRRLSRAITGHS